MLSFREEEAIASPRHLLRRDSLGGKIARGTSRSPFCVTGVPRTPKIRVRPHPSSHRAPYAFAYSDPTPTTHANACSQGNTLASAPPPSSSFPLFSVRDMWHHINLCAPE
jgi:hypothetical protein